MSTPRFVFQTMVLSLAALVLVFFAVGNLLADRWEVATERTITAPPDRVLAQLRDLNTWVNWYSAEVNLGNPTTREVIGTPGSVGHTVRWSGPKGTASLTLRKVDGGVLEYDYGAEAAVKGAPVSRGVGRLEVAADGSASRVRWTDGGQWESIALRWNGWFGALQERCKQIQGASLLNLEQQLQPAPK